TGSLGTTASEASRIYPPICPGSSVSILILPLTFQAPACSNVLSSSSVDAISSGMGGSWPVDSASPPKFLTWYRAGRNTSHCSRLMGISILGRVRSDPPLFAKGEPECMKTNETVYETVGRKPIHRKVHMRLQS